MEQSDTQRLDELATEVAALLRRINAFNEKFVLFQLELDQRLTALESARVTPAEAREGEPVDFGGMCACGHGHVSHLGSDCSGACAWCDCQSFRPATPPAPTNNEWMTQVDENNVRIARQNEQDDRISVLDDLVAYNARKFEDRLSWMNERVIKLEQPEPAPTVALDPNVVVSRGDLYSILNIVSKVAKTRADYDAYDRLIEVAGS